MNTFDQLLYESLGKHLCELFGANIICAYLKRNNIKIPRYLMYKIMKCNIKMCLDECVVCQIYFLIKHKISFKMHAKEDIIFYIDIMHNCYFKNDMIQINNARLNVNKYNNHMYKNTLSDRIAYTFGKQYDIQNRCTINYNYKFNYKIHYGFNYELEININPHNNKFEIIRNTHPIKSEFMSNNDYLILLMHYMDNKSIECNECEQDIKIIIN